MFDVTMTFDNGPDPDVTPRALRMLKEHDILASFFVVGKQLEKPGCMEACAQARDEGHWIGNHTYTHSIPLGERPGPEAVQDEIVRMQEVIDPFVVGGPKLFRPFGKQGAVGHHLLSRAARDHLVANKYTCVIWNALPRDWENRSGWDAVALEQCLALPWSVVVVHDIPFGNAIDRLPYFLDAVLERGGRFRQDLPDTCTPIRNGTVLGLIDHIVGG
ncbi:peptidoglycan/xylan/chitin deacetylase (PgdA/CDA1 family) [Neorhizobium galegae]|uniref:polysaccharide deacetylase family protein n=1 Tax=Neorhizobium galegae TaxID=399 RepID=UPI002783FC85|nr:polysaccharide deacetylase family protein [Neorhizobium galegae]MDQ0137780.1 peptidoglycan/xylan/chitin deacetylase (PgdA/CDA1 family) [Neorhizobium galegae]